MAVLKKRTKAYHVQFGNVVLYRWLLKLGLMPNKTKLIKELRIPDKYFFDFLRGHLDGDGTVRKYFDPVFPKSLRVYLTFISSSIVHILWIKNTVKRLLKIDGFTRKTAKIHSLTFSKYNSLLMLSKIYRYEGVPCLQRKYSIVKNLLV